LEKRKEKKEWNGMEKASRRVADQIRSAKEEQVVEGWREKGGGRRDGVVVEQEDSNSRPDRPTDVVVKKPTNANNWENYNEKVTD
jgi:hypothetical protein